MAILEYNDDVLLETGEGDVNAIFEEVSKHMPLPEEMKSMVLALMTYLLTM